MVATGGPELPDQMMISFTTPYLGHNKFSIHYNDVIMRLMAFQITSLTIVYSTVYQAQIKENIKAPCHWLLCGEFKGPLAQKGSIWWRHHIAGSFFRVVHCTPCLVQCGSEHWINHRYWCFWFNDQICRHIASIVSNLNGCFFCQNNNNHCCIINWYHTIDIDFLSTIKQKRTLSHSASKKTLHGIIS